MSINVYPARRSYLAEHEARVSGHRSPRQFFDETIALLEAWEPRIDAFVHLDIDAARVAANESSERWLDGRQLSNIDGMPIGVKDIIDTAHLPTEMGSPLFTGWRSGRDAASVAALREAGAVILGKTVTTEFAATHPGKTRNPWDTSRTPGGSSSGSAAAVGAGVLPGALGTQVIGSIVRPASYCGCVGFKPTIGAINRGGSFDFLSQSAQGALAATLEDAWAMLRAIAMRAGGDPGRRALRGPLDLPPAHKPRRIAVLETAGWPHATEGARAELARIVERCDDEGIAILDRSNADSVVAVERALHDALALSQKINTWEFRWPLNTLARDRDRNGLSPTMQARLDEAERMTVEEYDAATDLRDRVRHAYGELHASADVIMTLSAPGPAPVGLESTGNPIFAVPSSLLGVPALSLPLLTCDGLPLGLQLLGFFGSDAMLVGHASWLVEHMQ